MLSLTEKLISAKFYVALLENNTVEEKKNNILKCLDAGANINEHFINDFNNTPLHIAVKCEDPDIVKFLLQHGAKVNNINNTKETPLDIAKGWNTEKGYAIIKILEDDIKVKGVVFDNEVNSGCSAENETDCLYQKRSGTSGIEGQLYETKLLSLILIRALVNKKIIHFHLGTSLSGIDALDDICIRYKIEDEEYIIFLQTKHRKDINKSRITNQELWNSSGDFSLPKYFRSYLKIKEKFLMNTDDAMYKGRYEDVKAIFIIYTPGTHDLENKNIKRTQLTPNISDLIWSGKCWDKFQYKYTQENVELLKQTILMEDMKCLGASLYELKDKYMNMMCNDYIRKFHVVLAQKVFNVFDVTPKGYRRGTFRNEFFTSNDELLRTIKETIFRAAVSKTNVSKIKLNKLIQIMTENLTAGHLSNVLQNVNVYLDVKMNTLKILDGCFKYLNNNLSSLKVSQSVFNDALEIATKEKLQNIQFTLPSTFGNVDIGVKDEKKIDYLAQQIKNIISKTNGTNISINKNCVGPNKLIEPRLVSKGGLGTAIGNLLILDHSTNMLKFNMNDMTLKQNAKKLLNRIKSIPALETYRLQIDINDFPKLTFDEECNESITKDFLGNLWYFTSQAKEDETEKYSKGVLYEYHNENRTRNEKKVSTMRCDAIFLKIHDAIQKWWLKEGQSYYLKNNSQYYNRLLNDFENTSVLSIMNYICITKMDNYNIEFNEDSISSFNLDGDLIVIETEVNILTGIKLMQYFRTHFAELHNCTFIDLHYVLSLSEKDYDNFIDEIKNTNLEVLVIMFENEAEIDNSKQNIVRRLVLESTTKQIIIVTDEETAVNVKKNLIEHQVETVVDYRNNLIDLTLDTQRILLEKCLIFQGVEVKWNNIIKEVSKKYIKANILNRILNNERIEISKTLSNSKYEKMKDYYVTRSLRYTKATVPMNIVDLSSHTSFVLSPYCSGIVDEYVVTNTLQDLNDIVVLLAAPGMGKSTFLTHLSLATKEENQGLWIERIDLIDYGVYFNYLKERQIDKIEAIKFVCKTVLAKREQLRYNIEASINEFKFDIEIQNGEFKLKDFEGPNAIAVLTLELFIDSYNRGNTILLFDGFDEVCPGHKQEITSILKCLAFLPANGSNEESCLKQKMWITSRSYNNIRRTLEAEFGASYILEPFTDVGKDIFMEKYFNANLKFKNMNYRQFENIDGLFEYVKLFADRTIGGRKAFKLTDLLLRGVYFGAIKFFQSEIKHTSLSEDKTVFASKWMLLNLNRATINEAFPIRTDKLNKILYNNRYVQNLIQTPLHLYIAIQYLISKILDTSIDNDDIIDKWNLDVNTFVFYERFFEEKLKIILFQEKDQIDLHNTRLYSLYQRERKDFIDVHKKIAFYSIFRDDYAVLLSEEASIKIKEIIYKMEVGEEKTGVVDYIIAGIPKFVHLCFAEYLAVEYISDLIKTTDQHQGQIKLWEFIIHKILFKRISGVLSVFDLKLCNDCELRNAISNLNVDLKEFVFNELLEQTLDPSDDDAVTVLDDLVMNSLRYTARTLLTLVTDVVNVKNYDKFDRLLRKTSCFCYTSMDLGFTELMEIVFDCARNSAVEGNISSFDTRANNVEIINSLKKMLNNNKRDDKTEQEATQLSYIY